MLSMRFQVPQFIEVEDKVFGPFTVKQFIYLAGTGGLVVILYTFLPLFLTILFGTPIIALGLALAFYKVNNRPFAYLLEALFNYMLNAKLYLWKKEPKKKKGVDKPKPVSALEVPTLSQGKLKDLAWTLDVKESDIYSDKSQR